ncbi:MAG: bacterioferritin [Acidimicrobiaceae bacterium]|nr:bacterioferritin [Acidimicrobiaceae bacterium]
MTTTRDETVNGLEGEFLTDVKTLRERARKNMDKGPVTDAYGADLKRVIEVLNQALATELVCVLRYKRHYYTADGLNAASAADEFLEHAAEEADHSDRIAARIQQLGGKPDFNPETLTSRSHAEYDSSEELEAMIREDLVAERIAISSYTEIINWLGDGDPTSRRMLEEILAVEEEHAEDMLDLLSGINY